MDVFLIVFGVVAFLVLFAVFLLYINSESIKPSREELNEESFREVSENGYLEIPTFIRNNSEILLKDVSLPESILKPVSKSKPVDVLCRFKFICSRKWQDLESTDSEDVKFCTHCEQSVYLAKTIEVFDQFSEERKCTYWAGSKDGIGPYIDMPMMGRLVSKPEVEPSILGKVIKLFTAKWF